MAARLQTLDLGLSAAALACLAPGMGLLITGTVDWLSGWSQIVEQWCSLWIVGFCLAFATLVGLRALAVLIGSPSPQPSPAGGGSILLERPNSSRQRGEVGRGVKPATASTQTRFWLWAALLLAVCLGEMLLHAGEMNPFVASSRPTSGHENWTGADGYSVLLDGVIAQADGRPLLPQEHLFLGERPPEPSEFDKRAGHTFLVALFERPLGAYWSFAVVNLLAWWVAGLSVFWLGVRRWPGSAVPWIASLLVATGQGFIFMGTAPQAHAPAFASLAVVVALCDRLGLWERRVAWRSWAGVGWAIGIGSLMYLVYLPALLFMWCFGLATMQRSSWQRRVLGLVLASAIGLGITVLWQVYASRLLGLSFSGGNNDYAGIALRAWVARMRLGLGPVVSQIHTSSPRGLLMAAFYYPWWLLALIGWWRSEAENRLWAICLIVGAAIPAIALTTQFSLPRVAYFGFPAVYLLAARGIEWVAETVREGLGVNAFLVVGVLLVGLALYTNLDLFGWQQGNVWFHFGLANAW